MARPLTNAERQRRYIARLKAQANPDHTALVKELVQAETRIRELEREVDKMRKAKRGARSVAFIAGAAKRAKAKHT